MRVGNIVGVVCFVSLAMLGWVFLARGLSWDLLTVAMFWLILGMLAVFRPSEYQRKDK